MTAAATSVFKRDLVSIAELVEIGRRVPEWKQAVARLFFSPTVRLSFYRAFAIYQSQGIREDISLANWWNVITRRGTRRSWHPMAVMIPVLLYRMNEVGERWQSAFIPWLPANDAMLFRASRQTGITPKLMRRLTEMSVEERRWSKEIRKAIAPAMVNIAYVIILIVSVGLFYFPALHRQLPNMRITGGAAQLQALSNVITSYGILILALVVAMPFLLKRFLESSGTMRSLFDGMIGFSLYRQSTGMTFLLGLSAILEAGAKFEEAIALMKEDATPYVRERLEAALAYDDLKPADALTATGYGWPDQETLELLQLYMEMRNPHEGIDILVNDWFERAIEKYVQIGNMVSTLCQFLTWGIVAWLYIVSNELTTNAASFAHGIGH
jgi:hypothetical protein